MESRESLDPPGGAADQQLISPLLFMILLFPQGPADTQASPSATDRLSEVRQLYETGRWNDVVQAVPESPDADADLQFYRGLALAQLKRWEEAKKTFKEGLRDYPRDPRFLVELAGIAYREKQFAKAERYLRRSLALASDDEYANDFLASIYFLRENLEAALKYWNHAEKPKLSDLTFEPRPKLNPLLLDRTFFIFLAAVSGPAINS